MKYVVENNNAFFEVLQVAVGRRTQLSRQLTAEEWEGVYELCRKQAVVGIAFAALERLPEEQRPPGRRIRQWAVKADRIREHNERVTRECAQVCRYFEENGFHAVVLKGQANYAYYPEWLQGLRSAGDIDVWVWPEASPQRAEASQQRASASWQRASASPSENVRRVIEFCQSRKPGEYVYYHNLDFPLLPTTPVEVHYRPTWLYNPFSNARLQQWFQKAQNLRSFRNFRNFRNFREFRLPSRDFDLVFQLLHLYKHVFEEGVGLRQFIDYYFVLASRRSSPEGGGGEGASPAGVGREGASFCGSSPEGGGREGASPEGGGWEGAFIPWRFAGAVMYVLREVLMMPRELMLCEPREREGRQLLAEVLRGGNFGQHDERYRWAETTNGSMEYRGMRYALARLRHNWTFLRHYPSEVLWEPLFRIYHFLWRRLRLWRYG